MSATSSAATYEHSAPRCSESGTACRPARLQVAESDWVASARGPRVGVRGLERVEFTQRDDLDPRQGEVERLHVALRVEGAQAAGGTRPALSGPSSATCRILADLSAQASRCCGREDLGQRSVDSHRGRCRGRSLPESAAVPVSRALNAIAEATVACADARGFGAERMLSVRAAARITP